MSNLTIKIPPDLYENMQRYNKIKWAVVCRRAIKQEIEQLDSTGKKKSATFEEILARIEPKLIDEVNSMSDGQIEKSVEKVMKGGVERWEKLTAIKSRK